MSLKSDHKFREFMIIEKKDFIDRIKGVPSEEYGGVAALLEANKL